MLLLSGVAKVREPEATRDAFKALKLPSTLTKLGAPQALPWAELILGLGLVVGSGVPLVLASIGTLGLFAAYVVVIAAALRRGEAVRCGCFGKIGDHNVTQRTLVRNILLVLTGILAVWGALAGVSTWQLVQDSPADLGWVAGAALTGAVAVLILGKGSAAETMIEPDAHTPTLLHPDTQERVPVHTLSHSLLVFLEPGCGPCERVAASLPPWLNHDALRIIPVLENTDHQTETPLPSWGDPDHAVGDTLAGPSRPVALLLDSSGQTTQVARGDGPIQQLIAEFIPEAAESIQPEPTDTEFADAPDTAEASSDPADTLPVVTPASPAPLPERNGVTSHRIHYTARTRLSPFPEVPLAAVSADPDDPEAYFREPIPAAVLLDHRGTPVLLRELAAEEPVLAIAVDCTCSSTRTTMPKLPEWADRLRNVKVILISTIHPSSLPQFEGLAERTYYDYGTLAASAMGMQQSPAAVLLGADGLLAGGPVYLEEIDEFVDAIESDLRTNGLLEDVLD